MTYSLTKLLVGSVALLTLAPEMYAQTPARPKPQRPIEVPPAVVVLQIDTTEGDSTRTIIQRDFDYGDRLQPLVLDSLTMADIWKPGDRRINFGPLEQTRAAFVVRGRPTATGLHVEVFNVKGKLRQEAYFRLPRPPANRLTTVKDSLAAVLRARARSTQTSLAADSVRRDSSSARQRARCRSRLLVSATQRNARKRCGIQFPASLTAASPLSSRQPRETPHAWTRCTRALRCAIRLFVIRSAASCDSRSTV